MQRAKGFAVVTHVEDKNTGREEGDRILILYIVSLALDPFSSGCCSFAAAFLLGIAKICFALFAVLCCAQQKRTFARTAEDLLCYRKR